MIAANIGIDNLDYIIYDIGLISPSQLGPLPLQ